MRNVHDSFLNPVRFIDLFCGVGGFRIAAQNAAHKIGLNSHCVFSSDIDEECRAVYLKNFGEEPEGDIAEIATEAVPNHNLLLAGFPCQPFSIIGSRKGLDDVRGTLFFEIARIIAAKQPDAFVLENVKQLVGHDKGSTLRKIMEVLRGLGYSSDYRVFNALDFGLPQKRERIFIVGFRDSTQFEWPEGNIPMKPLSEVLEKNVPASFYASAYIQEKRLKHGSPSTEPTIWHENKSGHISAYPYSCALRAGASYNYLLVDGKRRLTSREMFRLQGFPDTFKLATKYSQARKQAGNSLPIPVAEAVIIQVLKSLHSRTSASTSERYSQIRADGQMTFLEIQPTYHAKTTP